MINGWRLPSLRSLRANCRDRLNEQGSGGFQSRGAERSGSGGWPAAVRQAPAPDGLCMGGYVRWAVVVTVGTVAVGVLGGCATPRRASIVGGRRCYEAPPRPDSLARPRIVSDTATASRHGVVTLRAVDAESGEPVVGFHVKRSRGSEGGTVAEAKADGDSVTLPQLEPGLYSLTFTRLGYHERAEIEVLASRSRTILLTAWPVSICIEAWHSRGLRRAVAGFSGLARTSASRLSDRRLLLRSRRSCFLPSLWRVR